MTYYLGVVLFPVRALAFTGRVSFVFTGIPEKTGQSNFYCVLFLMLLIMLRITFNRLSPKVLGELAPRVLKVLSLLIESILKDNPPVGVLTRFNPLVSLNGRHNHYNHFN
ncbi:MAG TPA: hypothetical protein DDZ96_00555 [Porphyromonadaceae bacterium]|nr:hypothetical protein [Porphyromonadaceae bacterium]HBK31422.1 hypothetical protein [Porphyromonadaceae bacterium]HBL32294.1 hypothetical protein [Porphyromonadaceae bacterium]HBX20167.1 hypothetical protein [Porphyromonadaceae bacterium]HBX47122.1 hypothetical protein [Porphyromonadaceae bacterium]